MAGQEGGVKMDVSLAGSDLFTTCNFALQNCERPSGRLRSVGFAVPGLDGFQTQIPTPFEHDSYELTLEGFIHGGSAAALRSLVLGSVAWRALVFSDLSPKWYQVQGQYVDESRPGKASGLWPVEVGFVASPGCLLGATVTDTTSPVANPGDFACPAVWTIAAAGAFTLTVGPCTARWNGGAGTVVINAVTCEVTVGGVAAPQYLAGGFPWLLPGNNAVTLTAGSFSCAFNPRYA